MNEPSNFFDYPLWDRVIRVGSVAMAVAAAVLMLVITIVEARTMTVSAGLSMAFRNLLLLCIFDFLVLVNHFQFPAIEVSDDAFRLVTPFYKSRWLNWNEIQSIKRHRLSSRFRRIIAIQIPGLNLFFAIIGFTQWFGGPGFMIHNRMKGYKQLLEILAEKRQDLVTEQLIMA